MDKPLASRTKSGPSFQVWKQLLLCHLLMLLLNKTAQIKVENSAQTAFRFSPVRYRAPRREPEKLFWAECSTLSYAVLLRNK
jgi:hypothetical protein